MQATVPLKWRIMSGLMNTAGRASKGISTGYRYGFDSGEMLDYVYQNRPSGLLPIGPIIDFFYLNTIGWRAIRARKELLKRILLGEIESASGNHPDRPLHLVDLASGPGRYLLELYQEISQVGKSLNNGLHITCRDLDTQGLQLGKARAEALGLGNVRYEPGDATDPASLSDISPTSDIVVVSGLYELFTNPALIKRSMAGIYDILPPGGKLVFTTQVSHPQLELIANVLVNSEGKPWVMVCRSLAEVEGFATEAGFKVFKSQLESTGLFGITVCEKA